MRLLYIATLALLFYGCKDQKAYTSSTDPLTLEWSEILAQASGTEVSFMMWQGSPDLNKYINEYIKPSLKQEYGIDLKIVGGQGSEIVQLLMGEKQANASDSQVDMVWINGETFFQLKSIDGLWGPFLDKLPNSKLIDLSNKFISVDFQQPINGMEAPWSITQFALVHDSIDTPNPPTTLAELASYVEQNPGYFTISNDFSGMTLLKSFLAELSGSPNGLDGTFDEAKYSDLSQKLWSWINQNKKYFWKKGETFPTENTKLNQMYANGEIKISYGFGEGGIDDKIAQGLIPKSTKAYPWRNGTIKNSNYLGIVSNSSNKIGAMVVINYLLSPDAQFRKADVSGVNANNVLSYDLLTSEDKAKYDQLPKRLYGPTIEELKDHAIQEPDSRYMIKLYEDFRKYVIEK